MSKAPKRPACDTSAYLQRMYNCLLERFGRRHWWPADTPFEVCVGAILTQNTAWKNVVRAIGNLKNADLLSAGAIHEAPIEKLGELIRPAGYFNVKARRLRSFVDHLVGRHAGDLDSLFQAPIEALREELLSINGIGPETADSMILYAAGKPIFVVDAYTRRVLHRHGLVEEKADYHVMQEIFHTHLKPDTHLYNDFHAQIVAVGHHFCKKTPRCEECPLRDLEYRDDPRLKP